MSDDGIDRVLKTPEPGGTLDPGTTADTPATHTTAFVIFVVAVVLITAVIMAAAWHPARSATDADSGPCGGPAFICVTEFAVAGTDGRLATADQFHAAMSAPIVTEWHLRDGLRTTVMPATRKYSGFTFFSTCIGTGAFNVTILAGKESVFTRTGNGCDSIIHPGFGFGAEAYDRAGRQKITRLGPYAFVVTVDGDVTDAEFFLTGEQ